MVLGGGKVVDDLAPSPSCWLARPAALGDGRPGGRPIAPPDLPCCWRCGQRAGLRPPLAASACLAALPPPGQVPLTPSWRRAGLPGAGVVAAARSASPDRQARPLPRPAHPPGLGREPPAGGPAGPRPRGLPADAQRQPVPAAPARPSARAAAPRTTTTASPSSSWAGTCSTSASGRPTSSARQTLQAAVASQDLGVQTVFLDAANAYFALLAAQGELAVAREVERINLQSFMAAEAKRRRGGRPHLQAADPDRLRPGHPGPGAGRGRGAQRPGLAGGERRRIAPAAAGQWTPTTPACPTPTSSRAWRHARAGPAGPPRAARRPRPPGGRPRPQQRRRAGLPAHPQPQRQPQPHRPRLHQRRAGHRPARQQRGAAARGADLRRFAKHYQVRAAEATDGPRPGRPEERRAAGGAGGLAGLAEPAERDRRPSPAPRSCSATKSLEVAQAASRPGSARRWSLLEAQRRAMADAASSCINALANWRASACAWRQPRADRLLERGRAVGAKIPPGRRPARGGRAYWAPELHVHPPCRSAWPGALASWAIRKAERQSSCSSPRPGRRRRSRGIRRCHAGWGRRPGAGGSWCSGEAVGGFLAEDQLRAGVAAAAVAVDDHARRHVAVHLRPSTAEDVPGGVSVLMRWYPRPPLSTRLVLGWSCSRSGRRSRRRAR